jgi:branched-chain amino acid transport system permease protein
MSGVGLVVLYRTTGVLNLFYGAIGAVGALTAWELVNNAGLNPYLAYLVSILLGGLITFGYGWYFGPPLADRDPLVKAAASLGLALILLGIMQWYFGAEVRSLALPTSGNRYVNGWFRISLTQAIAIGFPIVFAVATARYLDRTKVGTAMRALADNRENAALLGVPVRRVEAFAWFGSGLVFGFAGLLLAELVSMEVVALTFTLPVAALSAALIAKVESLPITVVAAFAIGLVQALLGAISWLADYRTATPFLAALIVLIYFGWKGDIEGRMA